MQKKFTGMNVGFIGLGTMGMPMVENLSRSKIPVFAFDIDSGLREKAAKLSGVIVCPSPAAVAERSDVIFSCLPNDSIVHQVYLEAEGISKTIRKGSITCDTSTVSATTSIQITELLASRGVHHLDTPMLGSQPQAKSGEIFFIVGGDFLSYEKVTPLLEILGKKHQYSGKSGSANIIKLVHNSLTATMSVAVSEAIAICACAGVDLQTFNNVVCQGGGMAYSTYFERRVGRMLSGEFSPTFSLELMLKDVSLGCQIAGNLGVEIPLMEKARQTYEEAQPTWGKQDFSAVSRLIEKRLGQTIFP